MSRQKLNFFERKNLELRYNLLLSIQITNQQSIHNHNAIICLGNEQGREPREQNNFS